jgi:serine/threonine protein kinase
MSLPSEYVIEDAVRSIEDIIVYRANHPIHDTVSIYLPDDTLPSELANVARKRLYQNGLQMRNLSLSDVPFVTKALEVSQNPNEPYIVTKYAEYDLEGFISNGVIIKPKRMFTIFSQVLQAIVNLATNGWVINRIHPRQIKLSQLHTGDISFTVVEGAGQQIEVTKTTAASVDNRLSDIVRVPAPQGDAGEDKTLVQTSQTPQRVDETETPKDIAPPHTVHSGVKLTATLDVNIKDTQQQLRTRQRNIYILGNITYQLLFGREYEASDEIAAANIRKLVRRWRKILEKALSQNIDRRYDTYETMLRDVSRALNRNKRVAIASIPFLLLLALIGGYFAYERYHQYKIMTSEAGQAIKSFLDIVDKTDDEFPELKKPGPISPTPDDETILSPFEKIEPAGEN